MTCDFCQNRMADDETGIHCVEHQQGGHAACGARHFAEQHP